jgi:hypothetical protein
MPVLYSFTSGIANVGGTSSLVFVGGGGVLFLIHQLTWTYTLSVLMEYL